MSFPVAIFVYMERKRSRQRKWPRRVSEDPGNIFRVWVSVVKMPLQSEKESLWRLYCDLNVWTVHERHKLELQRNLVFNKPKLIYSEHSHKDVAKQQDLMWVLHSCRNSKFSIVVVFFCTAFSVCINSNLALHDAAQYVFIPTVYQVGVNISLHGKVACCILSTCVL